MTLAGQMAMCAVLSFSGFVKADTSDALDRPQMYYTDTTFGSAFAKDPDVVRFARRYYMYYTTNRPPHGIAIGIAQSTDLIEWTKAGDILPEQDCEQKGLGAPAAIVLDGKVHLFYQTYGNGPKDAICHAVSTDAIHFVRNATNPVFRPAGEWNCGRAIDAEVITHNGQLLLYWATRDPAFKVQMIGLAAAPIDSDYGRGVWRQLCSKPILRPELPWEKNCIEAPAVVRHKDRLYMFYAGAYNNEPQQIGCAVSDDGIQWRRLSTRPLLPNGEPGTWNASESGHPGIFTDSDSKMYLFFQGNDNRGRTWHLSRMVVEWAGEKPYLLRPGDNRRFDLIE